MSVIRFSPTHKVISFSHLDVKYCIESVAFRGHAPCHTRQQNLFFLELLNFTVIAAASAPFSLFLPLGNESVSYCTILLKLKPKINNFLIWLSLITRGNESKWRSWSWSSPQDVRVSSKPILQCYQGGLCRWNYLQDPSKWGKLPEVFPEVINTNHQTSPGNTGAILRGH